MAPASSFTGGAMGFTTDATGRYYAFDFGAGLGLAAQFFVLDFYSKTADITARFRLSAFGSGMGASGNQ